MYLPGVVGSGLDLGRGRSGVAGLRLRLRYTIDKRYETHELDETSLALTVSTTIQPHIATPEQYEKPKKNAQHATHKRGKVLLSTSAVYA